MKEIWVSSEYLAKRFGVNQRTIQRWGKESKINRGEESDQYDLISADDWVIADLQAKLESNKSKPTENIREALMIAQTRKFEAEAKLKELDYETRMNKLIEVEQAVQEIDDAFARVKAKLLALPDRLALELSSENTPEFVRNLLESVIREALAELHTELVETETNETYLTDETA